MRCVVWATLILGSWLLVLALAGMIVLFCWSLDFLLQ